MIILTKLVIPQAGPTVCATGRSSFDSNSSPDTAAGGGAAFGSLVGTPRNRCISIVAQIFLRCGTQPRVDTLSIGLVGIDDAIGIVGTRRVRCGAIVALRIDASFTSISKNC